MVGQAHMDPKLSLFFYCYCSLQRRSGDFFFLFVHEGRQDRDASVGGGYQRGKAGIVGFEPGSNSQAGAVSLGAGALSGLTKP